jgi:hypothetical protein
VYFEQDYDEERLHAETILFWGVVGPQTGISVVLAERVHDLLAWLRERALVEGRSSWLSHALVGVEEAAARAGPDGEVAADAIGSALVERGIAFYACGPIERELAENELLRRKLWEEAPTESLPEGALRPIDAGVDETGARVVSPDDPDDEIAKGYRLDDEVEDLAEHVEIDFERVDHREFLIERLEVLKAPPSSRGVA